MILVYGNYRRASSLVGYSASPARAWISKASAVAATTVIDVDVAAGDDVDGVQAGMVKHGVFAFLDLQWRPA